MILHNTSFEAVMRKKWNVTYLYQTLFYQKLYDFFLMIDRIIRISDYRQYILLELGIKSYQFKFVLQFLPITRYLC